MIAFWNACKKIYRDNEVLFRWFIIKSLVIAFLVCEYKYTNEDTIYWQNMCRVRTELPNILYHMILSAIIIYSLTVILLFKIEELNELVNERRPAARRSRF